MMGLTSNARSHLLRHCQLLTRFSAPFVTLMINQKAFDYPAVTVEDFVMIARYIIADDVRCGDRDANTNPSIQVGRLQGRASIISLNRGHFALSCQTQAS